MKTALSYGASLDLVPEDAETLVAYHRQVQIWIIRILIDLGGHRRIGMLFNIDAETLTAFLELERR